MAKTSVEIDRDIAKKASEILGTSTLRETIDASMREVVNSKRRLELMALLQDPEGFDPEVLDQAWGGTD